MRSLPALRYRELPDDRSVIGNPPQGEQAALNVLLFLLPAAVIHPAEHLEVQKQSASYQSWSD
jgi:hypothetical protein